MNKLIKDLISAMNQMEVIDSHEHLPAEAEVIQKQADVLTRLFGSYSITNAISAGFAEDRSKLKDTTIPLEERWQLFQPWYKQIENTGYTRVGQIVAKDFYGIEEINEHTYQKLSACLQQDNKPGLYASILKDKCKIKTILNQGSWQEAPYAMSLSRNFMALNSITAENFYDLYEQLKEEKKLPDSTPEEWLQEWLASENTTSCVGIKFSADLQIEEIPAPEAVKSFTRLRERKLTDPEADRLGAWMLHKVIELAPLHNLVIAIHCGLSWDGFGNFAKQNPIRLIPLVRRYSKTKFDLYHGGIPWVREIAVMANQYPNIYLNLCWCHQISPYLTQNMLNEWIDLVPISKIIGFGGDDCDGPEKTYGVLVMAKENIARALAIRLECGTLGESQAIDICRMWLSENVKKIYDLQ